MKSLSPQHVVNTYRFYAPIYDLLFGKVLEHGRQRMCEAVHSTAPTSLLEVGVGTGLTLFNYPETTKVVGIDISTEMLEQARLKASNLLNKEITLLAMNGEAMKFPDDSFDCITVPYVLSVTPDPKQLIAELRRVCRTGGTIFVLNHFSGSRFWWLMERIVSSVAHKIGFRSSFCFEEHIMAHDWQVESVRSVNFMGLSKLVKIRNV